MTKTRQQKKRQAYIANQLEKKGYVERRAIEKRFNVSHATAINDIKNFRGLKMVFDGKIYKYIVDN